MNREESERRSWKIRFADGTIGICYGTCGDYIIEGR